MKPLLLRLLKGALGVVLCLSALLKYRSIDAFELYLFGFGVCSFDLCSLAARLLIGAEGLLGAAFLTGWWHRTLCRLYAVVLGGFSLWLIALLLLGDEGNCHCFGDAVELDAGASLLKNILLAAGLACVWRLPDRRGAPRWGWVAGAAALLYAALFAASPPDRYLRARRTSHELVVERFLPLADTLPFGEGRRLVALYSTRCRFCRLTVRKVDALCRRHGIDPASCYALFMRTEEDMEGAVERFFAEQEAEAVPWDVLPALKMLDLTNGALPLILLTEEGRPVAEYDFRTLDEQAVARFFAR